MIFEQVSKKYPISKNEHGYRARGRHWRVMGWSGTQNIKDSGRYEPDDGYKPYWILRQERLAAMHQMPQFSHFAPTCDII